MTKLDARERLEFESEIWPRLPLNSWKDTYDTLHLWSQMVGKISLALSPRVNHWWQTALLVSSRGLATHRIPYGARSFDMELDFIDHVLSIRFSDGKRRALALAPKSVADFHHELLSVLHAADVDVRINPLPQELPNPVRFDEDHEHASYDPTMANRHWRILLQADRLLRQFRSGFIGKASPVHFFWGSFDLALSLFSGRRAPPRPDLDSVGREAYSHEVMSFGFWPGSGNVHGPAFYAYSAPQPEGYESSQHVKPPQAFYNPPTGGYVLNYDDVRLSQDPDRMVLDFFQSTYEAGANLGHWDRDALERKAMTRAESRVSEGQREHMI